MVLSGMPSCFAMSACPRKTSGPASSSLVNPFTSRPEFGGREPEGDLPAADTFGLYPGLGPLVQPVSRARAWQFRRVQPGCAGRCAGPHPF